MNTESNTKIPRVGQFYKVSFEEFLKQLKEDNYNLFNSLINIPLHLIPGNTDKECETLIKKYYDAIQLPCRSTSGSAGYDFYLPYETIVLNPGESIKIPTGIKAKIESGWWLAEFPRSSHGFKFHLVLANTVGVIDSDYFGNENNEGHIFVKLINENKEGKTLFIKPGEAFCQGIFIPYGITYDDNSDGVRVGGIGSTSK